MKRIIPFLIACLFILSGIQTVASEKIIEDESNLISNDFKIIIAPIRNPNSQNIRIINDNTIQTIEEPKIFSVSYKSNAYDIEYFKDIKEQHNSIKMINNFQTYDYVIITTEDLYNAVISSTFIGWKTLIGYNLKIVNITDTEITSQTGGDLPEKIRNFLRSYYQDWGIKYVLIVGNHATIPMRYCYPDPTNHRFDIFDYTSGEVPTDYYYADLSDSDANSWDLDGDGYYGEYGQDMPDFFPEIYVGRIPTNTKSRITYTLDKIVTFEQNTGDWKENALHAGAFFYFTNEGNSGNPAMDGAKLSYYIEKDIMSGWNISHYSEQVGLEKSVYSWPALNEAAFINDWRNGKYSIVNWQGHGWTNRVARKVWQTDDGDGVPEANEINWPDFINTNSNLDDDFPSIVTAESCYVGCPEPATGGNLGIDLLTDPYMGASIGVIASARTPYGSFDWPNNPGGSDSIIYEFNRLMINDSKKVGEALYDSKFYCNLNYGWNHYAEYLDMFTFNLFGDPSLLIKGIVVENLPPDKPTIEGQNKGIPGNEYTYCIIASDPNEDDLYVRWDWDDGTGSEWLGPFVSGSEVCDSHIWDTKGSYTVSVTVEDEHGLSVVAYKEVTMPRSRNLQNPFLNWLQSHKYLFPILKLLLGL
ncbi:hypothetical protein AYK20_06120 [Thermoplasmatales archaeon SG8-52-1]|nr:MAG: hypothetical protein AYK20_06120 [Thermoplasmatales archaeon SG8-52-1]